MSTNLFARLIILMSHSVSLSSLSSSSLMVLE